jgi:hexosaminidase
MNPLLKIPSMSRLSIAFGCLVGALAGLFPSIEPTAVAARIAIVPLPMEIKAAPGSFALSPETVIFVDKGAEDVAGFLVDMLTPATGLAPAVRPLAGQDASKTHRAVILSLAAARAECGEEGYSLRVSPDVAVIEAATPAGLFYGVQTFRQLLPIEIDSPTRVAGATWSAPCVEIKDRPRFGWRGFMLDSCRHFQSVTTVKQVIDLMSRYKLNRFHWHLTEDEAWRIEVPGYPELTSKGAWRIGKEDGKEVAREGGFYSAADIKEIVDYARRRHVTVYPEIEMPGHGTAAIYALPQHSCDGKPVVPGTPGEAGIASFSAHGRRAFCPSRPETQEFLQDVALKVSALFDTPYFHIGADEVPREQWESCPRCRALIQAEGLKDNTGLQLRFGRKMTAFLRSRGLQPLYWGVDLDRGIPEGIIVQGWHPGESLQAVRKGFCTINSDCWRTYLDYFAGPGDVGSDWPKLTLEMIYGFDPVPDGATADEAKLVLGSEAPLWTERVPENKVTTKMFPRLFAFAEIVWSPQRHRDLADLRTRIAPQLLRFDRMGVSYYVQPAAAAEPASTPPRSSTPAHTSALAKP